MSFSPRILVSLHDVWPGNYARVDRDVQWLRERGVVSAAVLAVPCYHGQRPLEEEPAFVEWLRGQNRSGATVFAHGWRHLQGEAMGEKLRRSFWGKWMNKRAQQEGEFAGLAGTEVRELMNKAFLHFRKAGFEPRGWAFPAWMGRVPSGFDFPPSCRFLDGRLFVANSETGERKWAPALTFGPTGKDELFAYGGAFWRQYLFRAGLIRIALHPGDLEHESVRVQVEELLRKGKAVSYAEVF